MTQDPRRKQRADGEPSDEEQRKHVHDEELVDEQGEESFPASDPPANY